MDDIFRKSRDGNGHRSTQEPKKKRGRGRPKGALGKRKEGKSTYPGLTERESRFVDAYLVKPNAIRAAMKAGYAENTARAAANMMLRRERIRALLGHVRDYVSEDTLVDAATVIQEESKLAFSDIRSIPGCPEGIPDEIAYAISSFTVEETVLRSLENGDQVLSRKTKYSLWNKGDALARLERHLGMYERDNKQKSVPDRPQVNLYLEKGNVNVLAQGTGPANGYDGEEGQ